MDKEAWKRNPKNRARLPKVLARAAPPGVRLDASLAIDAKLPREFVLVLTADGDARRRCRTLWRDELELSVEFLPDPPKDSTTIVQLDD
jgi:hypothetical protein